MNTFLHAFSLGLSLSLARALSSSVALRLEGPRIIRRCSIRRLIRVIVLADSPLASPLRRSVCKGYDLVPSLSYARRVTLARHTSRLIPPLCRQTADRSHILGRGMSELGRRAGKINQPGGSLLFLTRGKTHQVRASWPLSLCYFSCVKRAMWVGLKIRATTPLRLVIISDRYHGFMNGSYLMRSSLSLFLSQVYPFSSREA